MYYISYIIYFLFILCFQDAQSAYIIVTVQNHLQNAAHFVSTAYPQNKFPRKKRRVIKLVEGLSS